MVINLKKYFSQWDGDNGGARGACGETCLKMVDNYLTDREISIIDIIRNGDNDPNITSIAGMKKAADFLGWGVDYFYDVRESDIEKWLSEGKLIVAVLEYGKFPGKYKQDLKYQSGHFVLITGITEDKKSIRFADPNFWGDLRWEGWRDNNKWASYGDFYMAFYHNNGNISRNGTVLVSKVGKLPAQPVNCDEEKARLNKKIADLEGTVTNLTVERDQYHTDLEKERTKTKELNTENGKLRDTNVSLSTELTEAQKSATKMQKRIDYLEPELDKKNGIIDDFKKKENGWMIEREELNIQISDRDGKIFELNQIIDALKENAAKELTISDALVFLFNKIIEALKKQIGKKDDIINNDE